VPGNEILLDLVDLFMETRRERAKAKIACFFEMRPSNVGAIIGDKQIHVRSVVWYPLRLIDLQQDIVVDETAGTLDQSEDIFKRGIAASHFNLGKFEGPGDEEYIYVSDAILDMAVAASAIRKQLDTCR
jgi:hypothetical protein